MFPSLLKLKPNNNWSKGFVMRFPTTLVTALADEACHMQQFKSTIQQFHQLLLHLSMPLLKGID